MVSKILPIFEGWNPKQLRYLLWFQPPQPCLDPGKCEAEIPQEFDGRPQGPSGRAAYTSNLHNIFQNSGITKTMGGFRSHGVPLALSKSLEHFSTETYGDLGILHFKNPPYSFPYYHPVINHGKLKSLAAYVSGAFNGNTMPGWITWNGGQEHSGHWTINFITKKSIGSCVCIYIYTYNVYILLKYVWYVYIYILNKLAL